MPASCLQDERQAGKIEHTLEELLAQRVFAIAFGYPDANDAAHLASDPIHKLLLGRDPVTGQDLASHPTLSRFENGIDTKELYRMSEALAASVLQRHAQRLRHRVRRVTVDLDPTDDPNARRAACVIIKAEIVRAEGKAPKDNPRFVITNLPQGPPWVYEQVTVSVARSRTESKNCMTCRSTAPVAASSGPASSACC